MRSFCFYFVLCFVCLFCFVLFFVVVVVVVGFLKYHANLLSFKTQKCLSVSRNNEIIVKFVINYHPSAINCRLVPLARDKVGRNGLKLEKC